MDYCCLPLKEQNFIWTLSFLVTSDVISIVASQMWYFYLPFPSPLHPVILRTKTPFEIKYMTVNAYAVRIHINNSNVNINYALGLYFLGSYKSPRLIQIYQYICLILIFNSIVLFLAFPLFLCLNNNGACLHFLKN